MGLKAVGFDLFGTLVTASANNETCMRGIYGCLLEDGLKASFEVFQENYRTTRRQQRQNSLAEQREVTNSVSVCQVANNLGHYLDPEHPTVKEAVRAYFQPWKLELSMGALQALRMLRPIVKLGLVTNFTDVSFIEESLVTLGIHHLFDSITISARCGWRKPNPRIFKILLDSLGVNPENCLFVGDEIESDIRGAKRIGILTVLVASPSTTQEDQREADYTITSVEDVVPIVRKLT